MITVLEERRRPAHSSQPDLDVRLKRVLVVVDEAEQTGRVLDYVISHAVCRAPIDAVLLYVRPPEKRGGTPGGLASKGALHDCEPFALRSAAHRLEQQREIQIVSGGAVAAGVARERPLMVLK